jgi:hypothetical protein
LKLEDKQANAEALLQAGKLLEAMPDLGFSKGKVYIFYEEGRATSVGIENAFASLVTCAKYNK